MKKALIILGDQLFPPEFYNAHKDAQVFMAEDLGLCTHFKYHKHKIIFFLSAMRTYAQELKELKFKVHYHELSEQSFTERLSHFLETQKISTVVIGEIQDKFFEKELKNFLSQKKINLEEIETPYFLCSRQDFKNYLFYNPKPFMKTFYERERKRLKIMLDKDAKPWGGQWSYDSDNRKKAPKVLTNLEPLLFPENHHIKNVKVLVDEKFSDHPGMSDNFWLPTSRAESLKTLDHFLHHHLKDFGAYQDAITPRTPFMYHSLLSPMINAGLLTPEEVINKAIKKYDSSDIPLASLEGFIRQVMGWREFVRGVYQNFSEVQESKNFFNNNRSLTTHWYEGTTGLPPVDDAILKAQDFGYCHHIERLMVLSNIMLLCEFHPHEVHRWFMEMFVDSADWVMGPNVYGMGQFSDGGVFATKPYISGSNYILKMSDYKKGDWCDIWDGLFWRFINKHRDFFAKQYRLSFMVVTFDKMDQKKKQRLLTAAEEFLSERTHARD
jgi:deoxyribodipyrimidine photolyase-related protein